MLNADIPFWDILPNPRLPTLEIRGTDVVPRHSDRHDVERHDHMRKRRPEQLAGHLLSAECPPQHMHPDGRGPFADVGSVAG
jgi:hypothetical protein